MMMMHSATHSLFMLMLLCIDAFAKERGLRGSSRAMEWVPLGGGTHNVASEEGQEVGRPIRGSLGECQAACDQQVDCKSFAFCGITCYLKDRAVRADDDYTHNDHCTTYYQENENDDDAASHTSCYDLFSHMADNNLVQYFPGNPDSKAKGFTTCSLCTNGTFSCSSLVYGGKTDLIASTINLASDGNGVNGTGDPVLSFCGDNAKGLINLEPQFPKKCAPYSSGNSNNPNMKGVFLATPPNKDMSVRDRVRDIAAYPGKYYFNWHSLASYHYWLSKNEGPHGMCRGVMELS